MANAFVKIGGKLVKVYGELLKIPTWIRNEGIYWTRVLAGGGSVRDRTLTRAMYKLWEEQGRLDNIRVAWFSEAGSVQRTSGIYRFFSRLFNLAVDGIKYTATQLVTNGNFANGTTGWSPTDSGAVISASNNILTHNVAATQFEGIGIRRSATFLANNKYYLSADIKTNNNSSGTLFYGLDSTAPGYRIVISGVNDSFVKLSGIVTAPINRSNVLIGQISARVGVILQYKNVIAINLTETFGAGNEPSKEVCDVIFADYFDGTKEVQLNDISQGVANSQPYMVNGAMVNPNGGSRFMTHPTVSFGAGDAWSVSTLLDWNFLNNASAYAGGGVNTKLRIRGGASPFPTSGISFRNDSGTDYISLADYKPYTGKRSLITFVADGSSNLKLYGNGVLLSSNSAVTNAVFSGLLNFDISRPYEGDITYHTIQSTALTPSQILEEYNLLRTFIPEIATTVIGTDEIATENCQMVATPKGNVIALNNLAGNVNGIAGGDFEGGLIGVRAQSDEVSTWTLNTISPISGTQDGRLQVTTIGTSNGRPSLQFTTTNRASGQYRKLSFNYKNNSGTSILGSYNNGGAQVNLNRNFTGTGVFTLYYLCAGTTNLFLYFDGRNLFDLQIDNIADELIGFAGAQDLYNGLISQGSTVSAALQAAAMWRSPDSDLDKQAVFGKELNKYATKLMAFDIAAYNAANPTTPWGYHVMTRAESQALGALDADTLKSNDLWTSTNGTNETGLSLLGTGVINADGTYSDFGTKTRLMTDDDFALDVNDDGTSTEIAVTTEGGILRLVKD